MPDHDTPNPIGDPEQAGSQDIAHESPTRYFITLAQSRFMMWVEHERSDELEAPRPRSELSVLGWAHELLDYQVTRTQITLRKRIEIYRQVSVEYDDAEMLSASNLGALKDALLQSLEAAKQAFLDHLGRIFAAAGTASDVAAKAMRDMVPARFDASCVDVINTAISVLEAEAIANRHRRPARQEGYTEQHDRRATFGEEESFHKEDRVWMLPLEGKTVHVPNIFEHFIGALSDLENAWFHVCYPQPTIKRAKELWGSMEVRDHLRGHADKIERAWPDLLSRRAICIQALDDVRSQLRAYLEWLTRAGDRESQELSEELSLRRFLSELNPTNDLEPIDQPAFLQRRVRDTSDHHAMRAAGLTTISFYLAPLPEGWEKFPLMERIANRLGGHRIAKSPTSQGASDPALHGQKASPDESSIPVSSSTPTVEEPDPERLLQGKEHVGIVTATKCLELSRAHVQRLVRQGKLVRVGQRRPMKISVKSLRKYMGTEQPGPTKK